MHIGLLARGFGLGEVAATPPRRTKHLVLLVIGLAEHFETLVHKWAALGLQILLLLSLIFVLPIYIFVVLHHLVEGDLGIKESIVLLFIVVIFVFIFMRRRLIDPPLAVRLNLLQT